MDVRLLYWALGVLALGLLVGIGGRLVDQRIMARTGWVISVTGVALLVLFLVLAFIGTPRPGDGNV